MKFLGKDPNILDAFYTATADGSIAAGKPVIVTAAGKVKAITGSDAGAGTPVVFESAATVYTAVAYDVNTGKIVIAYTDNGNANTPTAVVGTVNASDKSITFGTAVVIESGVNSNHLAATYDSDSQKVIIAYVDANASSKGRAIVGTVSGTSISFGTAVQFESGVTANTKMAYDTNAQRVVIAYRDTGDGGAGTAVVGTVSGTSISFGTPVQFEPPSTRELDIAYDANAQKVLIAYRDNDNSNYGTGIVGTVSGTSISFGTAVVFESATTQYISAGYDSDAQKVVISYRDGGNSDYGTSIVATVSGTSVSFGTPAVFESAQIGAGETATVYDTNAQKTLVAYQDNGNSGYGTAVFGTVSGTSISFDTPIVFETGAATYIRAAYDSSANKVVISYRDEGNSNYGTAVVFGAASTDLTTENYIGITDQAYTDGQDATVAVVGCIDRNQTSLTAGQQYFIQNDGTLSTTAGSPSVLAGTAISATELVVKE